MLMDDNFQPDKIMPAWQEGAVNEELPAELHDFFETFEVNPEFKVTVQSFGNEQYTGRPSIIGEYAGEIPNYERLVKIEGPRYFRYKILYKENGVSKKKNVDIDLTSKNWVLLAKEGDRERSRKRQDQIKEDMEEKNALMAYGGGNQGNQQSAKEAMKDTIDMMTPLLALMKGNSSDSGGMNFKEIMMFMMTMQQSSTNQMMNMFGMMSKQNSNLATAMLGNNGGDTDKFFNMAERMLGFQEKVSPKEESLIDKIGTFIGNNIEQLGDLLAKPREEREKDTGYQQVKDDWRFKKIKKKMDSNDLFAKRLIKHIDTKVGADTTDKILDGFIKYKRKPEQEPEKETVPAQGEEITQDDFEE